MEPNPYEASSEQERPVRAELVPVPDKPWSPLTTVVVSVSLTLLAMGMIYSFLEWLQWIRES